MMGHDPAAAPPRLEGSEPVPDRIVAVVALGGDWSVEDGEPAEPLRFGSRSAAEAHARTVARGLAELGCDVRIDVHDARNLLVGTIRVFAADD